MADQSTTQNNELVFCHSCENEWYKHVNGLTCPECHSEAVEIIEPDSDPRQLHNQDTSDDGLLDAARVIQHHHPWDHPRRDDDDDDDAPDPEEGDISHMEWTGPSGVHYSRTTYNLSDLQGRRGGARPSPGGGGPQQLGFDAFGPLLQSILGPAGVLNQLQQNSGNASNAQQPHGEGDEQGRTTGERTGPTTRGQFRVRASFGTHTATHHAHFDDLDGIFGTMLGTGPGTFARPGGGQGGQPPGPLGLLQQLFHPANAQMGDAVFSNEALDRVISQLMEQHSGSTAPGPASEAAITALPKITITKKHQDNNGKAECSICMEAADLGTEVTELPCKHWFHEDCVGPWLREHDTCPQCRRGITAKDGDADVPRQTGEQPRFWQMPPELRRSHSTEEPGNAGASSSTIRGEGTASSPYQISSSPPRPPDSPSRSRSDGRGLASGIAGWMGRFANRRGSTGNGDNNEHSNSSDQRTQ